jgi:gamma-glutamyl:cysteine ligase YbdK (ATP-grasp superfamily)
MNISEIILEKRRSQALTDTSQEKVAGELFVEAVNKILAQKEFFDNSPTSLGVEIEFGLTYPDLTPVPESIRDKIIDQANQISKEAGQLWSFQPEMGASQIEANQETKAILSNGFKPEELVDLFKRLDDSLLPAAHESGAQVLNMGIHPASKLAGIERTTKPKYIQVPNYHIKNRIDGTELKDELGVHIEPDASAVGMSQALQFNMSVESPKQGVDVLNWMIQMSPSILAITANSRLVGGVDTEWNEPRNEIWNKTHITDIGKRVYLPEKFYNNLEDVFERMGKFPLILNPENEEQALGIATGMNWLGGKLKFLTEGEDLTINKILTEFRPMSTQPTPESNAAAVMLAYGRLRWAIQNNEKLMPFEVIESNAKQAMKRGVDGRYIVKIDDSFKVVDWSTMKRIEVNRATESLVHEGHGSAEEISSFFKSNLPELPTSESLVRELREKGGIQNREVMKDVLIQILNDRGILR